MEKGRSPRLEPVKIGYELLLLFTSWRSQNEVHPQAESVKSFHSVDLGVELFLKLE